MYGESMSVVTFQLCLRAVFTEEDGWIIACFPDIDVASQGKTREEAVHNLIEATQLFVEACYERGTLDEMLKSSGFEPGHAPGGPSNGDHLTVPFELLASRHGSPSHAC